MLELVVHCTALRVKMARLFNRLLLTHAAAIASGALP